MVFSERENTPKIIKTLSDKLALEFVYELRRGIHDGSENLVPSPRQKVFDTAKVSRVQMVEISGIKLERAGSKVFSGPG